MLFFTDHYSAASKQIQLSNVAPKLKSLPIPAIDGNARAVCSVLPQDKKLNETSRVYGCCRLLAHAWPLGYLSEKLTLLS